MSLVSNYVLTPYLMWDSQLIARSSYSIASRISAFFLSVGVQAYLYTFGKESDCHYVTLGVQNDPGSHSFHQFKPFAMTKLCSYYGDGGVVH